MTPEYMHKRLMNHIGPYLAQNAGREYAKLDVRHEAILQAMAVMLAELHVKLAELKHAATRFDAE